MKVLVSDGLAEQGLERLQQAGFEVFNCRVAQEQLIHFIQKNEINVLLVRSSTKVHREVIKACPSLRVIGRAGVGLDNIDVEFAKIMGVKVLNTPLASSASVAELVFAHFLALARNLHDTNRTMPLEGDTSFQKLKKFYRHSVELRGKTLGIIGLGNIGKEVAKIGISLGMNILACGHKKTTEKITLHFFDDQKVAFDIPVEKNMDNVLTNADFISIHTPFQPKYLIDRPAFEKMKKGVFLVNTARGGLVNELVLEEFIENETIAGAALDVFEGEPNPRLSILMNPKISLSPHLGGSTLDAQQRIAVELADAVINTIKSEEYAFV